MMEPISLEVFTPRNGFRWTARDNKGRFHLAEPPSDWPSEIYSAARSGEGFSSWKLAASTYGCTEQSQIVRDTDLYLQFASKRPTPSTILEIANAFGMLGSLESNLSHLTVQRADALLDAFDWGPSELTGFLSVQLEDPIEWLWAFDRTEAFVRGWSQLAHGRSGASEVVNEEAPNLTLHLNASTNPPKVVMRAATLRDLIKIQCGLSISTGALPRKCEECPSWFIVNPGVGRPEKKFCSNACKVRAMRNRKREKKRGAVT